MKPLLLLLLWKSNKCIIFLCVRARVRAYMRACVWVRGHVGVACARVVILIQHATRMRPVVIYGLSDSTILFDIVS